MVNSEKWKNRFPHSSLFTFRFSLFTFLFSLNFYVQKYKCGYHGVLQESGGF